MRADLSHVVAVAQLVEHWIVIPVVAGSSPVGHPKFLAQKITQNSKSSKPQGFSYSL